MLDFKKLLPFLKTVAQDRRVIAVASAVAAKSVYAKAGLAALFALLGVQ